MGSFLVVLARNDVLTEVDTQTFVDDVAAAVEQKIWEVNPQATAPTTVPTTASTTAPTIAPKASTGQHALAPDAPVFVPKAQSVASAPPSNNAIPIPTGPRADRLQIPTGPASHGRHNQLKKRKHQDRDGSRSRNSGNEHAADNPVNERPLKQIVRHGGGNGSRGGPTAMASSLSSNTAPFAPLAAKMPTSLPPLPPMDPSNPFGFLANMSAMWSQMFSGQALATAASNLPKPKCPDYENKGICKLGTFCPYSHGDETLAPADPQYDPNKSSLAMPQSSDRKTTNDFQRREPARAPLPQPGSAREADTVLVEQIPEDRFTEQHVRDFFTQFGPIVDVQMHGYKRLAIVKFSDHPAAQRAYDSPKVIFDNRFVKVNWHEPEKGAVVNAHAPGDTPEVHNEDEDMIDLEEIKKKQAQIQVQWQEKRKKAAEVDARYKLLDAQASAKEKAAAELNLRIQAAERAKGVEKIRQKEQRAPARDLAKLQSEAEGLFANAKSKTPQTTSHGSYTNGRGSSFRGGYRGRGGARGGQGAVARLDNRPRRVGVARVESGSEKEQALKRFLLNAKGCNGVQPHLQRADTLVVSFEQRYQADMVMPSYTSLSRYNANRCQFMNEVLRIAGITVADLSWIPNNALVTQPPVEPDESAELKNGSDGEMPDGQDGVKTESDLDADDMDECL